MLLTNFTEDLNSSNETLSYRQPDSLNIYTIFATVAFFTLDQYSKGFVKSSAGEKLPRSEKILCCQKILKRKCSFPVHNTIKAFCK